MTKIDKRDLFQIEIDPKARTFSVRLTVDFSAWRFIPQALADRIKAAVAEYEARGYRQV